jgi:hypothetical protein
VKPDTAHACGDDVDEKLLRWEEVSVSRKARKTSSICTESSDLRRKER